MRVTALDVYREPLPVAHVITVERLGTGAKHRNVADVPAGGAGAFETAVTHHYLVRILADGYGTATAQVPGTEQDIEVPVPMRPSAVVGYQWPDPLPEIPGLTVDPEQSMTSGVYWGLLEAAQRAALLNIWAKLWDVNVGVSPAASFVEEVLEVQVDRIIVRVTYELPELLEDQDHLDAVPSGLHDPPPGYTNGISVKSKDRHGNVQISTFVPIDEDADLPVLADIDIDENRSTFAHLFDVLEHTITGNETNQVEVHEILVHAGVDPGWRPLLA